MAFQEFTGELDGPPPTGPVREFSGQLDGEPASQAAPEPSIGQVALNAIPKGIANLANTPHTINSLVIRGLANLPGLDHLPQVKEFLEGVANHPELSRNRPMELMQKLGAVNPEHEPQTGLQRIVDTAIQAAVGSAAMPGLGAVNAAKSAAMGAASGATAGITKEITGSDLLAAIGGMTAPFAAKAAAQYLSTSPKKLLLNPTAKMTLQEAQSHGYVVEPSQVRQPTSTLETIAGKAAIAQEASLRNQAITNNLAARSIGLPDETPLSMGVLEEVRKRASQPYEDIAKLIPGGQLQGLKVTTSKSQDMLPGPATGLKVTKREGPPPTTGLAVREIRDDAGNLIGMKTVKQSEGTEGPLEGLHAKVTSRGEDVPGPLKGMRVNVQETRGGIPLEELKQARNDASAFYRHYDRSADPSSLKAGKAAIAKAMELESQIDETVTRLGRPELVNQLRAARQMIARTYDVERALNLGDGNVSAHVIGRMFDQGRPLTGELQVIGKFAQAFPRVTRDASNIPPSGVSGTDAAMAATLGLGGAAASGSPAGLAAAGLPLLRNPAKQRILSKRYQERLLDTSSGRLTLNLPKSVARASALMTGKTVLDNAEESP
ncbi:MAG: hypothetical protein KGP14_13045 [Betaproteobacteria bacterium]|nr:hypothetical protein [Betaproteobacteria bacterium]